MALLSSKVKSGETRVERARVCAGAFVAAAVFIVAPGGNAWAQELEYDVPALPVDLALLEFARQSKRPLLFPYDRVQAIEAQRVKGRFELEEGLVLLLQGTGLRGTVTNDGVITVSVVDAANAGMEAVMKDKSFMGRLMSGASGLVLGAAAGSGALAQDSGAGAADEITVTGIRSSIESAVGVKRDSSAITDSITAEGIGRFPDLNLAESLQRITGVQIDRVDDRRGSIAVRGLGGDFVATTYNGQAIASPSFIGGFDFGAIDSDIFSGVDVYKTPTVKLNDGGMSGIVDLRTQRALSMKQDQYVSVVAKASYEGLAEAVLPNVVGSVGKKFNDSLAMYATVAWSKQQFRRDTLFIDNYVELDVNGDGAVEFVPEGIRNITRLFDGDRMSGVFSVGYAPAEDIEVNFTAIGSRYSTLTRYQSPISRRQGSAVTNPTVIDLGPDLPGLVTAATFPTGRYMGNARAFDDTSDTWSTTLDAEWRPENWIMRGVVHYTQGGRTAEETSGARVINTQRFDYDLGGAGQRDFSLIFTPDISDIEDYSRTLPGRPTNGNVTTTIGDATEFAAQFDVTRVLELPLIESVDIGVKYRRSEQEDRQIRILASTLNAQYPDDGLLRPDYLDSGAPYFGGALTPPDVWVIDELLLRDFITENADSEEIRRLSGNAQDIYAAYGSANFRWDIANWLEMTGNAGVRYVYTERKGEGLISASGSSAGALNQLPVSSSTDFDDFLPQANLRFAFLEDLVLRASYSKTMVRPNTTISNPGLTVFDEVATGSIRVLIGNAALEPFTAKNYDLSLEWYNRPGSVISVAYFRKKVNSRIVEDPDFVCPSTLPGLESIIDGSLAPVGSQCQDADGTVFNIDRSINAGEEFPLQGVEISAQQALDMLPAPFDGFGVSANYTYVDAAESGSFDPVTGDPLPLGGVSKHSYNLVTYYETPRFGVRLAYNWRGAYFVEGSGLFANNSTFVDARAQLDLSATYSLTDNISLGFEAFNLNNAERYQYQLVEEVVRQRDYDGRTFAVSLNMSF